MTTAFPAKIPLTKPADRPLSTAMQRMYDVWNPYEDRGNELFSNFHYTSLEGLPREPNVSRRDPSKVIRVNGIYYVYYTCRRTDGPPVGHDRATDTIPSTDWDLADIWVARSSDGSTWEELGPATQRPPKGDFGWRSNCTPDILLWKGKYHLFYQAYSEVVGGGDSCPVTMAESGSPVGPFKALGRPVVERGNPGDWDQGCIHDPYPLVYKGRIWLYYKASPGANRGGRNIIRAQGVAIADDPGGPFAKSPLNPITNSGHETCLWPFREGVAALLTRDGPEKNTIQYAPDGLNFEMRALVLMPPYAAGPFVPDAFADSGDGRGITWGLSHICPEWNRGRHECILVRFDCALSRDVDRPFFRRNNAHHYDEHTHLQPGCALPGDVRKAILREREQVDRDTIGSMTVEPEGTG